MESPRYLATGLTADTTLSMSIITFDTAHFPDLESARQEVYKSAVIETYPGQKPVQGSWHPPTTSSSVTFTPTLPLAPGDYVIRFPKASSDYVVRPRPYNLFRVGSAVRLAEVVLLRDKTSTDLVNLQMGFSELPPSAASFQVDVRQAQGASWAPVAATMVSQHERKFAQAIDPTRLVKITVTGASLDGKWTGAAGSGPIVAEFLPKDHMVEAGQVQYYVPPDLTINLPSGTKKQ